MMIIHTQPVSAHKMMIIPEDEGVLQVLYEDGSFSTRTIVTVYDKDGSELESGPLDEQGSYSFNKTEAHFIVATDGLGHRTEWTVGEEVIVKSDPHRWLIGGAVFFIFIGIALFFYKRTKNHKSAISQEE